MQPLITPIDSNFIADFPGTHSVNSNNIDDYAGLCLTSHPLQTYTPQLTAITTSPTLGPGAVQRGFFYEIFDQIYVWGEIRFGTSGINVGSGTYLINLPFNAKSNVGVSANLGSAPVIGNATLWDDSTSAGRYALVAHLRTANQMMFSIKYNSGLGRVVSDTVPITWAVTDGIFFTARFQRQS